MAADAQHSAPMTPSWISAGRASLEHAEMTERKVVLDGILGVEASQCCRDFLGRLPGYVLPPREAQICRQLVNVRVDRNQEDPRRNGPEAQVDAVARADHPPQVEKQALAAA